MTRSQATPQSSQMIWMEERIAELETLRQKDTERLSTLSSKVLELERQNTEMAAAIEAVRIDADECLDFDECTAMLVPLDTYHALVEPAADLLAKRDQWRDAALLREIQRVWGIPGYSIELQQIAELIESGEWAPYIKEMKS